MARKLVCDRCGRVVEYDESVCLSRGKRIKGEGYERIKWDLTEEDVLDLCVDCTSEFDKYLHDPYMARKKAIDI